MRNFAQALQKDLSSVESGEFKLVPPGTYETVISGVERKVYKAGSSGLLITYKIMDGEQEGNDIRENIVLFDPQGVSNDFAAARLKRRLLATGFTAEYITNGFKYPEKDKDLGDFKKLIGKSLVVTIEHKVADKGQLKGKTMIEVKKAEAPATTTES